MVSAQLEPCACWFAGTKGCSSLGESEASTAATQLTIAATLPIILSKEWLWCGEPRSHSGEIPQAGIRHILNRQRRRLGRQ